MKNKSVVLRLGFWLSLVMIAAVGITFFAVRLSADAVLRGTIRGYLIGTVEENAGKISFVTSLRDTAYNVYIPYADGYLQIDIDYMDVVNDVRAALYSPDGQMLYGEDPLAKRSDPPAFSDSRLRELRQDGVRYDTYERKLTVPGAGELWIRGVVPETESALRLREMTRIALFMLPALLVLFVFSGVAVTRRLLSPLSEIARSADAVSKSEDLNTALPERGGRDEIGRLSRSLNLMLQRLKRAFENERRFTSDASHELRTPTAVILAQSEYILEKPRTGEEYREAFETVKRQSEKMTALIGDMLDYTRLEQNGPRPMERMELSSAVRETADSAALIGERGISLESEIEPGVFITGERLLITRLLNNLISNAYRYGKDGGHIYVKLAREGQKAVLSVRDDGVGIASEDTDRIFERFYRGDRARSGEGTGLGLSIVKKIADLHGAEIKLDSAPGEGSCFEIIFSAL